MRFIFELPPKERLDWLNSATVLPDRVMVPLLYNAPPQSSQAAKIGQAIRLSHNNFVPFRCQVAEAVFRRVASRPYFASTFSLR
jgi:hypothetical protein